jgi:hypothetical protein
VIAWDEVSTPRAIVTSPPAPAEDFALSKVHGLGSLPPRGRRHLHRRAQAGPRTGFGFLEASSPATCRKRSSPACAKKACSTASGLPTATPPAGAAAPNSFRLVDEWFISMDGPESTRFGSAPLPQDWAPGGRHCDRRAPPSDRESRPSASRSQTSPARRAGSRIRPRP